jgi:hypothetical protein
MPRHGSLRSQTAFARILRGTTVLSRRALASVATWSDAIRGKPLDAGIAQ